MKSGTCIKQIEHQADVGCVKNSFVASDAFGLIDEQDEPSRTSTKSKLEYPPALITSRHRENTNSLGPEITSEMQCFP